MNILLALASMLLIPSKGDIKTELNLVEQDDDTDMYFDRAVFISLKNQQPTTPGIFFKHKFLLTSFNPFRDEYRKGGSMPDIIIMTQRIIKDTGANLHKFHTVRPTCARQVVPIRDQDTPWHGTDRAHSPLHDLLVLRISEDLDFMAFQYTLDMFIVNGKEYLNVGPLMTSIANPADQLERDVKFASLGFVNMQHILSSKVLSSRKYKEDENIIVDCDEWFPKTWGHFICISNVDYYKGVGSGALLVHKWKLFGVGSFLLQRGNRSILVFTDVRPYYKIIYNTCRDIRPPVKKKDH